jgi:hypothetical protein
VRDRYVRSSRDADFLVLIWADFFEGRCSFRIRRILPVPSSYYELCRVPVKEEL